LSELARTKTGIIGLDEVLEGGIPRNFAYAVVGAPGSGKTIMGAQYLYRCATQYAENGIYVTLEEAPYSFANNMIRFNWNMFDLESQGKLVLLDGSPHQEEPGAEFKIRGGVLGAEKYDLDGLIGTIANARKRVAAKRCVIDGLSSIASAYRFESEYRFKLLQFLRALSELELTTLMLIEADMPVVQKFGIETTMAQGSFLLHTITEKEAVFQVMEIQKLRGVRVFRRLIPYRITPDGFEVRPQEPLFQVIPQ
jgi:circadian clock protein KaiC